MKLEISNFGIIQNASINIDGLTVIAGENDTGKSTIGKLLFAIIKANMLYKPEQHNTINYEIDRIILELIDEMDNIRHSKKSDERQLLKELEFQMKAMIVLKRIAYKAKSKNELDIDLKDFKEKIKNEKLRKELIEAVEESIIKIEKIHEKHSKFTNNELKTNTLKKILIAEFKHINCDNAFVKLTSNKKNLVNLNINEGDILNPNFLEEKFVDDISLIETPFLVSLSKLLLRSEPLIGYSENENIFPVHIKDLAKKLILSEPLSFDDLEQNEFNQITQKISQLIDGEFYYDEDKGDFVLIRNKRDIPSINIASGIKSLGLFNILLKAGFINPKTILILDEPETNLHPKWQNEYMKILCQLVKQGVKIIIASHSPYIISALEHYTRDIPNKNFYWASKQGNNLSIFEDKTETVMEDIVQRFANTFSEIY